MSVNRNSHRWIFSFVGFAAVTFPVVIIFIFQSQPVFGNGFNRYEFIAYPDTIQSSVDSLDFDLGYPRSHPGSGLRLTNKNGNLPLTESELVELDSLAGIEIIGSDSIEAYLQENGWNAGGGE